jgi:hypothetical protein
MCYRYAIITGILSTLKTLLSPELRLTLLGETGFETTWDWVVQCDGSGSSSFACGAILDGQQQQATCAGSATTATASIQTATLASTFESATAIAVDASTAFGAAATDPASLSTSIPGSGTKRVVLTVGLIVAIIVGPTLALIIGIGIFIFLRKRSSKKYAAIRLNSAPHPPPNGPVGADQVNPYEMGFDESVSPHPKYEYSSAKVDAFEVSGGTAVLTGEKKWDGVPEMGGDEQNVLRSPRSPAPMYSETMMPVELDGTSSFGGRYGR